MLPVSAEGRVFRSSPDLEAIHLSVPNLLMFMTRFTFQCEHQVVEAVPNLLSQFERDVSNIFVFKCSKAVDLVVPDIVNAIENNVS